MIGSFWQTPCFDLLDQFKTASCPAAPKSSTTQSKLAFSAASVAAPVLDGSCSERRYCRSAHNAVALNLGRLPPRAGVFTASNNLDVSQRLG